MSNSTPTDVQSSAPGAPAAGATPLLTGQKVITLRLGAQGAEPARVFRLHKSRVIVGSVVSADVRLGGPGVAPVHAVIELEERKDAASAAATGHPAYSGQAMIYDLASESGVQVNGQRSITQRLKAGDKIRIGGHELTLSVDELSDLIPRERTRESEGRRLFLDPAEDLAPLLLEDGANVQQIFEYAPAQARALEVIMAWRETVLDVEHFTEEREVTLGTSRDCHFGIPPLLPRSPYALATRNAGADYALSLEPGMKGVMQRNGSLQTLDEIREAAGRVASGGSAIPLLANDFAKVTIGEIDFYLCYTPAPPRLKRGRVLDRDPVFLKIMGSSMVLTVAVIATLMSMDAPQPIEADQLPERIATILYQPEKFPQKQAEVQPEKAQPEHARPPEPQHKKAPEPKPTVKVVIKPNPANEHKPVPKEMRVAPPVKVPPKAVQAEHAQHAGATDSRHQSEAKEGEGARAKGTEGIRGQKSAAPGREHQDKAMRPAPQGGKGQGAGDSQIQNEGNVDILKAATGKIQDILGNSAAHLGAGGEKLKGYGGFTTQGNGGLALSGNGKGGGGDADSLGGLGKKGHGGGRVGTGLGASGSGNGIIGGQSRVAIRTGGPEEAVVMGSIDADAVEAALLAHKDEFRLCYEKEVNAENPSLAGRVGTTFVIGSTGRVTHAGIESTSLHNANTERCILTVIKRIDFPIPRGAGVVQVSYPFKFSPVGK